jgi:hypothetical protein
MAVTVPIDGRPQFSLADVAVNVGMGRRSFDAFEQVGPDRYVLAGQWPKPAPTPSGAIAASAAATEAKPMTPARALWPNLPTAGGGR